MKTSKTHIGSVAVFLLLAVGCDDKPHTDTGVSDSDVENTVKNEASNDEVHTGSAIIESTGDIIIDIQSGIGEFKPFRMLNDSNIYEEVKGILGNADWETAEVNMIRPSDYRFEVINNEAKEKSVSTIYYLWVSPGAKNVELVAEGKSLYVQLNKSDSEKLFKILTDKQLSDHVIIRKLRP
ncbi:hypothetical protein [Domibacillus mangrovi]|uniref:YhfM-like domain-containing protein n=1 Tax=Domibacillus mangrovi TaxID=1714354 RepID=A0A1Q5P4M7_9BACI|nr:hypothetical protein [Domibacillus mangrovi]OKL37052.1 hypothetical protein BLL40_05550 [Domibacillus mangrovi]